MYHNNKKDEYFVIAPCSLMFTFPRIKIYSLDPFLSFLNGYEGDSWNQKPTYMAWNIDDILNSSVFIGLILLW